MVFYRHLCAIRNNLKNLKVVLIDKVADTPHNQDESIAVTYMNRFAIKEDDQFEIAAFQTVIRSAKVHENDVLKKLDEAMESVMRAVKNLTKLQTEGLGYFNRVL